MKIELDFEVLKQTGLSADEYLYLYIIYRKGFNYLEELNLNPDLVKLETEGYIKLGEYLTEHRIGKPFIDLFTSNTDQMFIELNTIYPMKVVSPNRGIRILHAKDPNATANKKAKTRYSKIVKNKPHLHKNIVSCLKKQLVIEKENLAYLQNLETWINNHTWEKYENVDYDENNTDERRITRQL